MTCFGVCFKQNKSSTSRETLHINEEISSVQQAKLYSYKELQLATGNFSSANKIGEGGFGSVYKGRLNDGTLAAIKVLSAHSEQGVREFLNEIVAISGLEHESLVKLYGCCAEGEERMLVYSYMENNSIARTLLGGRYNSSQFSWNIRTQICIGVAQGLAFLHDEVKPPIVHRDIKASNILLDKDFTPKISDFGLAKLFPTTMTHVTTRVAGTLGYLAPEYAIRGKLTRKADIYSFGVLLMEIISGRCNTNKRLPSQEQNLLERAWRLYENDELVQLVDTSLEGNFDPDEACRCLKVGLLCTQDMPKNRPAMSIVAKMLKGEIEVDEADISKPGLLKELMTLKRPTNKPDASSSGSGQDESSSFQSTNNTRATMTFTSIYDRSN
ncbi:Serine/threonine protein kinase [Handroanthus impetiginosus]|uniref:Serine/threonine protein kinase n=1 Tax=Handroanthus impetiginosus TaxID=429701 RepID=A0A2G9HGC1_9LAMI|nr:Serine/threonine protein kinase [Handroanthus impetiginosus]